jgi:SAM-dependent methyltransferase
VTRVIWHDLECGGYHEDLRLWRELAADHGDPVLEVGAGTGRVALALARAGHRVTALDLDPDLLAALRERADGNAVETVVADARDFELERRFALCLVPMQTIQLLGGSDGRRAFLHCVRQHLTPDGAVAMAIAQELDLYELTDGGPGPLPDIVERDGIVYSSQPTAVRPDRDGFVLERRRESVTVAGVRSETLDRIHLDRVSVAELEAEASDCGLRPVRRATIPPTLDYVGSEVVILDGA